jgi:hypothetical protein
MKALRVARARSPRFVGDPYIADLLENIAEGKTILQLGKNEKVFSQGDTAEAIYFIEFKCRSFAQLACDGDTPTVRFDHLLDDRQAQSQSASFLRIHF